MRKFVVFLFGFTLVAHLSFAIAADALARCLVPFEVAPVVAVLLSLGLVGLLHGRIKLAFDDAPVSEVRQLFERCYYVHWSATLGGTTLLPLLGLIHLLADVNLYGLAYPLALVVSAYGVFYRARVCQTRVIVVPIRSLGAAFEGYRVVQLSDIHVGSLLPPAALRPWVEQANRLDADLIALTGDYVTSGSRFHQTAADELGRLRAKDGVLAVMGNHDNWDGGVLLRSRMREHGIVVLENDANAIARGEHRLVVLGIDDIFSRRADVDAAVRFMEPDQPTIALAHDPRLFEELARKGVQFVMSGHTHWGQVAVPFLAQRFNVMRIAQRYGSGMCAFGDSLMYTHPGCGTTGVPIRLGVAPEITVFVLKRADVS